MRQTSGGVWIYTHFNWGLDALGDEEGKYNRQIQFRTCNKQNKVEEPIHELSLTLSYFIRDRAKETVFARL